VRVGEDLQLKRGNLSLPCQADKGAQCAWRDERGPAVTLIAFLK